MSDKEFLELLNLYLDHEISAEDAARLEAAVQANPERRELHRQYCRMQKACRILAADPAAEASRVAVSRGLSERVMGTESGTGARSGALGVWFGGVGALAAAACVVLLFNLKGREAAPPGGDARINPGHLVSDRTGQGATSLVKTGSSEEARMRQPSYSGLALAGTRPSAPRLNLVGEPLVLSATKRTEPSLRPGEAGPADDQLEWVRNFQLTSLADRQQAEALRFETAPATLRPELRRLQGPTAAEATAELAAFRFVR